MKIWPFEHTSHERRMWRGWLSSGHVVEVHWGREPFGIKISECDDDGYDFRRQLWFGFGFVQAFIPLWRISAVDTWDRKADEWGVHADREHIWLRWGKRSKSLDWPWTPTTLAYEKLMPDGSWRNVFKDDEKPNEAAYPYTYVLESGEVQRRTATVSKRRHVLTFTGTKVFKWPRWVMESIDVSFDAEVGERSGSWKGGCLGCAYTMRRGEYMLDTLRRMETERKF